MEYRIDGWLFIKSSSINSEKRAFPLMNFIGEALFIHKNKISF